jgi:hypothetical protein
MKKIFTMMLSLATFIASAQKEKMAPYISVGAATNYLADFSLGGEIGLWGIESPLTVGLTFSGAPKINDWYVGIKPYFTLIDAHGFSMMIYTNPQMALSRNLFVIEEGLGFNVNLSRKVLFGWYFGVQSSREMNGVPLVSGSFVYLFRKNK